LPPSGASHHLLGVDALLPETPDPCRKYVENKNKVCEGCEFGILRFDWPANAHVFDVFFLSILVNLGRHRSSSPSRLKKKINPSR